MDGPASISDFDAVPVPDAAAELYPCCTSRRWIGEVVRGRPYRSVAALSAASDAILAAVSWADIEEALAAHPRIGERTDGTDRDANWSRQEQASTQAADEDTHAALREGNTAYERRFGHVFLICATGLSTADLLTSMRKRLNNDAEIERDVVRRELVKIVRIRLAKAFC